MCGCLFVVIGVWIVANVVVTLAALAIMLRDLYSGIGPVLIPEVGVTSCDDAHAGKMSELGFLCALAMSWVAVAYCQWLSTTANSRRRVYDPEEKPLLDEECLQRSY